MESLTNKLHTERLGPHTLKRRTLNQERGLQKESFHESNTKFDSAGIRACKSGHKAWFLPSGSNWSLPLAKAVTEKRGHRANRMLEPCRGRHYWLDQRIRVLGRKKSPIWRLPLFSKSVLLDPQ